MAGADDEDLGHRPDRLWRVEERQRDILARLERLQARLDETIQRRDNHDWKIEQYLEHSSKQLDELARRPIGGGGNPGPLGEMTPLVKVMLMGLLGLVATLALGKAFWPG